MQTLRFDQPTSDPLFTVSWDRDIQFRMHPQVVTNLLREQVPVLEFVDWRVTKIELGSATSVLPLNAQSTNQHFTHQAAMFVLSADYTGGTALSSLFLGWPVVGVHPINSTQSISLWLLRAEVKYVRPSVGDLTATAVIAEDRRRRLQKRFLDGKPVIESVSMSFYNGDKFVAEATATYFARQSTALRTEGLDVSRVNSLYELKLTSSAELIAGVRAQESGGLFVDPFARSMAGQHGMALATRFCQRSPQLGGMVAARTRHLDDVVERFLETGGRTIVNVGVGWDMRAFRLDIPEGVQFYELDFPTTLNERRRRIEEHGLNLPRGVTRTEVPIDLRTMPLADTLRPHLNGDGPLLVIWEGMSMYFQEDEVRSILASVSPLLSHPDSLLWLDMLDNAPIAHAERFPESVQDFLRGMQILGEPFSFGNDRPNAFLREAGFQSLEVVSSDHYFPDVDDPVYSIYQFCVVTRGGAARPTPKTFQAARLPRRNMVLPSAALGVEVPAVPAEASELISAEGLRC